MKKIIMIALMLGMSQSSFALSSAQTAYSSLNPTYSVMSTACLGGCLVVIEANEAALDYLQNNNGEQSPQLRAAFDELKKDPNYSELSDLDLAAIVVGKALAQREK